MTKKRILMGMLVMVLAFGLVVTGCDNGGGDDSGDGGSVFKISVTGLQSYAGQTVRVYFGFRPEGGGFSASGYTPKETTVGTDGVASVDYSNLLEYEFAKNLRDQKIPINICLDLEKDEYGAWNPRHRSTETYLISVQNITAAYSADAFETY